MGMSTGGGNGRVKADINVTPLVDVVLVLLIIFMVVTPMLQRGKDVQLPKAQQQKEAAGQGADPLIVSMTPDRKLYLESDAFDEAGLEAALRRELSLAPGRKVLLKGDSTLSYGDVRKVLDLSRKAGAQGVSLGVEEVKP
ncbi:MAG: biopolymer transporter ExbD [Myxococcaceae bacterium]